MCKMHRAIDKR